MPTIKRASSHLTLSRVRLHRVLADGARRIKTNDRLTILGMMGYDI